MLNASQGITITQGLSMTSGLITLPTAYTTFPENASCKGYNVSSVLSSSFSLSVSNTWTYTNTKLNLDPGTWMVLGNVYINGSNSKMNAFGVLISTSTTSIDTEAYNTQYRVNLIGMTSSSFINLLLPCMRIISSSTLPFTAALWTQAGWGGTAAPIVHSGNTSNTIINAVRIA